MEDGHIPKDILHGQIAGGEVRVGCSKSRFKDTCKQDTKASRTVPTPAKPPKGLGQSGAPFSTTESNTAVRKGRSHCNRNVTEGNSLFVQQPSRHVHL